MTRKNRRVIFALLLILSVSIPIPWIAIQYRSKITFDPASFFGEYLRFFGSLIAVFLAFFLVEVFWASEKGLKKAEQIRKIFTIKIENIYKLVSSTKLELVNPKGTKSEVLKSDEKVLENLKNLGTEGNEVIKIINEQGIAVAEDKDLESELFKFLGDIDPIIRELSAFDSIRPDLLKIIEKLSFVQLKVGDMLKRLKGEQV